MSRTIRLCFLLLIVPVSGCAWLYAPFYTRDHIVPVDVSLQANMPGATTTSEVSLVRCFIRGSELDSVSAAVAYTMASTKLADLTLKPTGFRSGKWSGMAGTAMTIDPSQDLRRLQERMADTLAVFSLSVAMQKEFIVTPDGSSMKGSAADAVERFVPDAYGVNFRPEFVFAGPAQADATRLQGQPLTALSLRAVGVAVRQLDHEGTPQRILWSSTATGTQQP